MAGPARGSGAAPPGGPAGGPGRTTGGGTGDSLRKLPRRAARDVRAAGARRSARPRGEARDTTGPAVTPKSEFLEARGLRPEGRRSLRFHYRDWGGTGNPLVLLP